MKRMSKSTVALVLMLALAAHAAPPPSNAALAAIQRTDVGDRSNGAVRKDWKLLNAHDEQRRDQVLAILRDGGVRTSADFAAAALVFQHANSADDFRLAYSLATVAAAIDPGNEAAKLLSAQAWDRMLMRSGKPQWYGTQFVRSRETGRWQLYDIDESAATDEQRAALNVPPLAQAKERANRMNATGQPIH